MLQKVYPHPIPRLPTAQEEKPTPRLSLRERVIQMEGKLEGYWNMLDLTSTEVARMQNRVWALEIENRRLRRSK